MKKDNWICENCGEANSDEFAFCNKCGANEMLHAVEEIVKDATQRFIDQYRPALVAFDHVDKGHTITWVTPHKMVCSCGTEAESNG